LERARIGDSRHVRIELVINGRAVERREILADGILRAITFVVTLEQSSWLALRILPSSHSAPIYVHLMGRPIRASRRSAQWCIDCLDMTWMKHAWRIRESERPLAAMAFGHARKLYQCVLADAIID
jgi:hypothetical protein